MRPLVATAALLAAGVLAAGCGSGPGSDDADPDRSGAAGSAGAERALAQFLAALEAGSCTDVKAVVVTPSTVDCELVASLKGSFADEGVDLADVTLDAGRITGDSATVTIDWGTADQDDETWDVERVDGSWRVLYDSAE